MVRNTLMECEDQGIEVRFALHDRDGLFVHDFDHTLEAAHVRAVKTPFRAPNANAHAERWVLSASSECLDHLVLFGLENLRRTVSIHRDFHNEHRPHQGIGNHIPAQAPNVPSAPPPRMPSHRYPVRAQCAEFLGGLLKSYSKAA